MSAELLVWLLWGLTRLFNEVWELVHTNDNNNNNNNDSADVIVHVALEMAVSTGGAPMMEDWAYVSSTINQG